LRDRRKPTIFLEEAQSLLAHVFFQQIIGSNSMVARLSGLGAIALVALAAGGFLFDTAPSACAFDRGGGGQDLFYNYYVPAGPDGGAPVAMYVSPRPTPPFVGQTYITYQPLMPHEFLHPHVRVYKTNNPGAGRTMTTVHWNRW
jgi:hypothetical protein